MVAPNIIERLGRTLSSSDQDGTRTRYAPVGYTNFDSDILLQRKEWYILQSTVCSNTQLKDRDVVSVSTSRSRDGLET